METTRPPGADMNKLVNKQVPVVLALLFAILTLSAHADTWIQLQTTGYAPTPDTYEDPVAYDQRTNTLIVFHNRIWLGTTGVWVLTNANGLGGPATWTQIIANIPDLANEPTAVYDPNSNRLILFGGEGHFSGDPAKSDVWVLSNANGTGGTPQWTLLTPVGPAPPGRVRHRAVYDTDNNRMILFGGCGSATARECHTDTEFNDVWVLANANGNGTPQWIQISPSGLPPTRRVDSAVGYDPGSNTLVIFGGSNDSGVLSDTWVVTNANGLQGSAQWTQLLPQPGTIGRRAAAFGYNPATNQLVIAAGLLTPTLSCPHPCFSNDSLVLQDARGIGPVSWTELSPEGTLPSPREGLEGGAIDTVNNRLILTGGQTPTGAVNDVWVLALTQTSSDTTPPVAQCGSADALWHGADVAIACTAGDSGSGLADAADASFSLVTSVANETETANASTSSRDVCDVAGNCATVGPISGNKIDKKAPDISIASPVAGAYTINQSVTAAYACSDGGSGVGACTGTVAAGANVNTSLPGATNFTVNATDQVGNAASRTLTYLVSYGVCLLFDPGKAVNSGATLPIKLQLCDANHADVSSPEIILSALGVVQVSTSITGAPIDPGNANPDSNFRFDASLGATGGYIFNLSTKGLTTGTYNLTFKAGNDETVHSVSFQVK